MQRTNNFDVIKIFSVVNKSSSAIVDLVSAVVNDVMATKTVMTGQMKTIASALPPN